MTGTLFGRLLPLNFMTKSANQLINHISVAENFPRGMVECGVSRLLK